MRAYFIQILTIWSLLIAASAQAEVTPTFFYKNTSIALNHTTRNVSEDTWVTNIGYNYQILPKFNIDFGYLDIRIENALANPNDTMSIDTYHGMFGAAKYVHDVANVGQLYASGGFNYITTKPTDLSYSKTSPGASNDSEISPYLSVGASIPSNLDQNLNLNVELSYQNLQLDTPSTMLTVGAQYRF